MNLGGELAASGEEGVGQHGLGRLRGRREGRAYRVGETMIAPISRLPSGLSRRRIFSNTGITNERVLPDPVTACTPQNLGQLRFTFRAWHLPPKLTSTTTSLCCMNSGMVLACTGVICSKPMSRTASNSQGDREGFSRLQAPA